jgi:pimeloyl-ACP methyl ester carboxylesterase
MDRGDGVRLAFARQAGKGPTIVWLSGFNSDMGGTKAEALAAWSDAKNHAFLRLDYSGHGRSEGDFADGTISRWRDDALAVIDAHPAKNGENGDLVLIGSSMGGWIALLIALARPDRTKGLILIAPAPDFTEAMWPELPEAARRQIETTGRWDMPSDYDPAPTPITRGLIEDGRRNLLLNKPIPFRGPVQIYQGMCDPDVPWTHAVKVAEALESPNTALTLIKDGDHRLSRPQDIARLLELTERFLSAL